MKRQDRVKAAEAVRHQVGVSPQTARDFKNALGVGKSVRLRQAEVVSLSATENTATIKMAGSTVAGVPYFTCLPCPNFSVWTITDGEDVFIFQSMGPAPTAKVSRTSDWTHNSDGNSLYVAWEDPMSGSTPDTWSPQNGGFDWWESWGGSGNEHKLFAPAPGIYNLWAGITWTANNTGRRTLFIYRNDNTSQQGRDENVSPSGSIPASLLANGTVRVTDTASCWFAAEAYQNSGGNLTVQGNGTGYSPILSWTWTGPASPSGD